MVPSLDTVPVSDEANGLTALMTCGSLATLVTAWLTADWCVGDRAVPGVEHDLPAVAALLREVLFSRFRPVAESVPDTV